MPPQESPGSQESAASQENIQPAPEKPEIDLPALADRILMLLKEEARLERERQDPSGG